MKNPRVGTVSLIDLLLESSLLPPSGVSELRNRPPAAVIDLLLESAADNERLATFLAEYMGLKYIPPGGIEVASELVPSFALLDSKRILAAPLEIIAGTACVAVANPLDVTLIDRISGLLDRRVEARVASTASIQEAARRYLTAHSRLGLEAERFGRSQRTTEDPSLVEDMRDAAPIVRLVDTLLKSAVERGASDIHIEGRSTRTEVRFRIDGVLQPAMEALPAQQHDSMVTRIKVLAGLDVAEKRAAQDGRFSLAIEGKSVDFRVSILPAAREGVVLRLLRHVDLTQSSWRLDQLGLADEIVVGLRRAVRQPQGLVLISGPTGSGKTTTLYAALAELDAGAEKLITIEDPVEYTLDGVTQIPVNEHKKFTFANGLRSVLRHDPDKIMVGEIRDRETAEIAVQSALTGHLVLSTVHANGALEAVNRFTHMGADRASVVDGMAAIFAQRLIRTLCPSCKVPAPFDSHGEFAESEVEMVTSRQVYGAKGCPACNYSGYRGRQAIGEYLRFTPELRDALFLGEGRQKLSALAREQGMRTLRENAIEKVLAGLTSVEEVCRVTGFV